MAESTRRPRRARKTKRPNGAGSVYQRKDRRWSAQLVTTDELGRRWRRTFYATSEKEARAKLLDAQYAVTHGLAQAARVKPDTFAAYLTNRLDNLELGGKSAGTMRKYRQLTRDYIEPALGHLELPKVTSDHVQAFYKSLVGRLSSSSIEVVHAILHGAFRKAVAARPPKMLYNPASLEAVDLPDNKTERREEDHLTNDQVAAVLTTASTEPFARWRAAFTLMVMTGMRRGELLALTWDNVDMAARTIQIKGSLKPVEGGGMAVGSTKSPSALRTIVFGEIELEALREHWQIQLAEKAQSHGLWEEDGYVVASATGRWTSPSTLRRKWDQVLAAADLPPMDIKSARHAQAGLMDAAHVDLKVRALRMGHSDVALTMGTYTNPELKRQRAAADALNRLVRQRMG